MLALREVGARALAAEATAAQMQTGQPLRQVTARLDADFFAMQFDQCDAAHHGELIADDFEFYRDRWGKTAGSRPEYAAVTAKYCERQAKGEDYRARRELDGSSLEGETLGSYGAVELGTHRFYKLTPRQPEELTETARFAIVWQWRDGTWRMARVISYTHQQLAGR